MGNGQTVCDKYLLCLYLFEYQDAFQMNTNIRIIRIIRILDIRMRTLINWEPFVGKILEQVHLASLLSLLEVQSQILSQAVS